ncbi:hypothetical protein [Ferruginibacter albus]|uniref:hypothetical protein n=1 Tax=Ferruginibacter albus TaxID=2875540 RepID=UPI001CC39835|nr:hypothetical protein [Ferruginibacter albus]UAY51293.1 hypothetical protein K9M53_11910 [Ferruginibacter albus]
MERLIENSIDWEDVIVRLEAFTRSFLKKQHWFHGGGINSFLKGKEMRDYVYEGIGRFLKNPEKYDSSKGDLVSYLKWNLIRSLVSNDATSDENLKSKDIFRYENEDCDGTPYLDRILPYIEPMFSDELDYNLIKEYIEEKIKGDKIVEEIFLGVYSGGMKRKEIISEFKMTENDYDNGNRRLQTVIREATAFFKVKLITV